MPAAKPKAAKPVASVTDLSAELLSGVMEECGDEAAATLLGSDGLSLKIRGVISTQNAEIDAAIGRGGIPLGRLTIIHGAEACVDAQAFVGFRAITPDGHEYAHGGTIQKLWELFHTGECSRPRGYGGGPPPFKAPKGTMFTAPSMNEDGCIVQNEIVDVVKTGDKPAYKVVTDSGNHLVCTLDHKFWNGANYIGLSDLKVGDVVYESVNARNKKSSKKQQKRYDEITLKRHPNCRKKPFRTHGYLYHYHVIPRSRALIEAQVNGLTLDEYKAVMNGDGDYSHLRFLRKDEHVHHINGDWTDNSLENLELKDGIEHVREHAIENHNNLRFVVTPTKIASIEYVGERSTYDLKMNHPYHNYIVNKLVTHNSGKTTLCLHLVAEVQAMGGIAVYMDKEYKLDPEYAASLGVDTSKLIVSQPDYLEQIFKLMDSVVKRASAIREKHGRRVPILVVLDSMNSCITKEMFEAEYGKREMAGNARVFSANLPKLMPLVHKEDVALVFISQVRQKMNVMFGDDEEIAGGNAPKFFASLVLHVKRLTAEREGEVKIGNKIRVEPKKNQIAPPFRRAEVLVRYGKGFDKEAALLARGLKLDLIKKEGNTFSFNGEKLGIGEQNAVKAIRKSDTFRTEIAAAIAAQEPWNKA